MTVKELIEKLEKLTDEEKERVTINSVDGASDLNFDYEYFEVRIPEARHD